MNPSFANVAIGKQPDGQYLATSATVMGLGQVRAKSRDAFCAAVGAVVFEKDANIQTVHFTGPGRNKTTLQRKPDAV